MEMAITSEERAWIWKLDVHQCYKVLEELEVDHEGENNLVALRASLSKIVPKKIQEERFKGMID